MAKERSGVRPDQWTAELSDRLCDCGCGGRTMISPKTRADRGWVKGEPRRFIHGHQWKASAPTRRRWAPADRSPRVRWVVDDETGCWTWRLGVDVHGYGKVTVAKVRLKAHRWAYEEFVGPIPEGHVVHHECENKLCVNPGHLRAMTNEEHSQHHGAMWRRAA